MEINDNTLFNAMVGNNMKSVVAIGSSATGSDLIINDAGASYTDQTTTLSAAVVKVSAANAADTATGTGARTVLLSGVDANYNEISEVIALNGQTAVNSVNSYLFVNSLQVLTTGSGNTNAGIIYVGTGTVTTGVPATQYIQIPVGVCISRAGFYVVPAGYSMVINNFVISNGTATNASTIKLWSRTASSPYARRTQITIPALNTMTISAKHVVPEKTFIKCTGNNVTSTSVITAVINYYLQKNQ